MTEVAKHIVKISCQNSVKNINELGSGFICFPNDSSFVYILTAKHCIFGEEDNNGAVKTDIQVYFFTTNLGQESVYQITQEDQLITGGSLPTEDIALLVIEKVKLPFLTLNTTDSIHPFKVSKTESKLFVNGFPLFVNNEVRRTLYNCILLPDNDFINQFQIEINDAVTNQYNADELVQGYSGSGIFMEISGKIHVGGVVSQYEPESKRFHCIHLKVINKFLLENNLPELTTPEIETSPQILADLKKLQIKTENVLGRIYDKIGTIHLDRTDDIQLLHTTILSSRLSLVSGIAGAGKSAITKDALNSLINKGYSIIAFKGEDIDRANILEVFQSLQIKSDVTELLDSNGLKTKKIILIDSIEKLLETNNADTIVDFFNLLQQRQDTQLVLTCRSYAVEQLKIRFLQQFPNYTPFEVPLIGKKELTIISQSYPFIATLLQKPSLKKILQIPFNLNMATKVREHDFETVQIDSESDFKALMWTYVIEKKDDRRGNLFTEIALKRANQLVSFVKIDKLDKTVLNSLVKDNIIEKAPKSKNRYTPAHDIYEDWALTRYIEDFFQDWKESSSDVLVFFSSIGSAPSIRRVFRIWVSEKLQIIEYGLEQFLTQSLTSSTINQHWKDEILIAILQSNYSKNFLAANKELLFNNEYKIFQRCLLLLKVACRAPDSKSFNQLPAKDQLDIYKHQFLKPIGEGWENMIDFIYQYIDELDNQLDSIIQTIFLWQSKLDHSQPLPSESRKIGLITLRFLHQKKDKYYQHLSDTNSQNIAISIGLLLRLVEVLQIEVKTLIEKALVPTNETRTKAYHEKILELVLSYGNSLYSCKYLPELTLDVAEKVWFYHPSESKDSLDLYKPVFDNDNTTTKKERFGIIENPNLISGSSPYKTFMLRYIFENHIKGLEFIVKLFNHSISTQRNFELNSGSIELVELAIELIDGKTIKQHGNIVLWCMYRGGTQATSTPPTLQSVLMALEEWFLYLSKLFSEDNENKYQHLEKVLLEAFNFLLGNSKSVAITSLLASVSTAYPNIFKDVVLPILGVKEFYHWDISRCTSDMVQNPIKSAIPSQYLDVNRENSDNLPHRRSHLEILVKNLCLGGLGYKIFPILDRFYAENPHDKLWKLALNRMDFLRKSDFIKDGKNLIIQPKVDDDLIQMVTKNKQIRIQNSVFEKATLWARNSYKSPDFKDDRYEEWKEHYQNITTTALKNINRLAYNPELLAVIGLRDVYENLDEEQRFWCYENIIKVVEYQLTNNRESLQFYLEQNTFDPQPCLKSLPLLINKYTGSLKQKAKGLLFDTLLFIEDGNFKQHRFLVIKYFLWHLEPSFALSCIAGIIQYSKIAYLKIKIDPNYRRTKEEEQKQAEFLNTYNQEVKRIKSEVVNQTIDTNIEIVDVNSHTIWTLFDVLSLIPPNTTQPQLQQFLIETLKKILVELNDINQQSYDSGIIPMKVQMGLGESLLPTFLLYQDSSVAIDTFRVLIDDLYDPNQVLYRSKMDFIERCFRGIIGEVRRNDDLIPNFQLLWDYLLNKITSSNSKILSDYLLLSDRQLESLNHWKPIEGRKSFFKKAIFQLESPKSTLQLLSGIGFTELMPDGIDWLVNILRKSPSSMLDNQMINHGEKLVQRVFYDQSIRIQVRNNKSLRENFLYLLDLLINNGSSTAFYMRENFIKNDN